MIPEDVIATVQSFAIGLGILVGIVVLGWIVLLWRLARSEERRGRLLTYRRRRDG